VLSYRGCEGGVANTLTLIGNILIIDNHRYVNLLTFRLKVGRECFKHAVSFYFSFDFWEKWLYPIRAGESQKSKIVTRLQMVKIQLSLVINWVLL
jgi:hypothetical protein